MVGRAAQHQRAERPERRADREAADDGDEQRRARLGDVEAAASRRPSRRRATSTSAVPSLKRLSPSMIAASRCGTRTLRNASSTLTVSVMESSAPSSSATENGRPSAKVATAAVPSSEMATPGTASARIGRARLAQAVGVGRTAPPRRRGSAGTRRARRSGSSGVCGQHVREHEHQADDHQRDVVGHADPLRADGDGGADRQHDQQLFEVLTHGRAADGDGASDADTICDGGAPRRPPSELQPQSRRRLRRHQPARGRVPAGPARWRRSSRGRWRRGCTWRTRRRRRCA